MRLATGQPRNGRQRIPGDEILNAERATITGAPLIMENLLLEYGKRTGWTPSLSSPQEASEAP